MVTTTTIDYVRQIEAKNGSYGPAEAWTTAGCEEGYIRHVTIQMRDNRLELVVSEGKAKTKGRLPLETARRIEFRELTPDEREYIKSQLQENKKSVRLTSGRIETLEAYFGIE